MSFNIFQRPPGHILRGMLWFINKNTKIYPKKINTKGKDIKLPIKLSAGPQFQLRTQSQHGR